FALHNVFQRLGVSKELVGDTLWKQIESTVSSAGKTLNIRSEIGGVHSYLELTAARREKSLSFLRNAAYNNSVALSAETDIRLRRTILENNCPKEVSLKDTLKSEASKELCTLFLSKLKSI